MGNDVLDNALTLSTVLPVMYKSAKSITDNLILLLRFTLLPLCNYIRER